MAKRKTKMESMEQFRISLENVHNQPFLASTMAVFGYTEAEIAEGKKLYETAKRAHSTNDKENKEYLDAKKVYDNAKDKIVERYKLDRKKAKIVFKDNDVVLKQLSLTGLTPIAHVDWSKTVKSFYEGVLDNNNILEKLARLGIKRQDLEDALLEMQNMELARTTYFKEKGESEDTTKQKDQAFLEIDRWMREFYSVAKIAMEDQPQLLEALGVYVRS